MNAQGTAAALASALPTGITYDIAEDDHYWLDAREIAAFQAERLAESGWVLVWPDDETVERVAAALRETPADWPGWEREREWSEHLVRAALAALREVQ